MRVILPTTSLLPHPNPFTRSWNLWRYLVGEVMGGVSNTPRGQYLISNQYDITSIYSLRSVKFITIPVTGSI